MQGPLNLRQRAEEIDAHFDGMLYDGMDEASYAYVEEMRTQAHRELQDEVFKLALSTPMRAER